MSAGSAWLLAAALWLGALLAGPPWLGAAGLVVLLVGAVATRRPMTWLLTGMVGLALVGAGLAGSRGALVAAGALPALARDGGQAAVEAVVVTDPRTGEHGWWAVVRVEDLDGRSVRERALLRGEPVATARGSVDAAGEAAASGRGPPLLGQRLAFTTSARPLGHDGFDGYLRRLHAGVALQPGELELVAPAPGWLRAAERVRARVRAAAGAALDPSRAGLLAGLVTGDTSGLPAEDEAVLTEAGLSHLVAVSGSNVALVLVGASAIAGAIGLGARGRSWALLVTLGCFVVLVRAEPSVVRAAAMALLVIAAGAWGRGRDARQILAAAVVVVVLVDPLLSGQLGFALSVLATGGVLVVAPWVAERLPGPRRARLLLGAAVGAQFAVAPLLLGLDGAVPLAALPANVVAVPAAAVASSFGMAAAILGQVWLPAGAVLAWLAGPALGVVLWAGRTFAGSPELTVAHLLSPVAALLAVAVVTRRRSPRLAAVALVGVVALAGLPTLRTAPDVTALTVTVLDVGQGDAVLVEAPGTAHAGGAATASARLLVDGGPDPDLALDHLRARGVRQLDVVAISHPHADHTDGLPAVLAGLPVAALLVGPGPPVPHTDTAPSAPATVAVARQRGVAVTQVAAGMTFPLGAATVEVLSPPADGSLSHDVNEGSLVLRVSDQHGRVLLTGDAELLAQERLLRRPERVRAEVLKVPHHGGATNAPGFLAAVGARTALVSVGADNDYGHPHPDVLAALAGTTVARTDVHGDVTVTLGAGARSAGHDGDHDYTRADAAPADVPLDRPGGAAAAARGRPSPRGAARRCRRSRRHRPAGGRRQGARAAGPAHRVAVRRPEGGGHPRRAGAARRGRQGADRRARRPPARRDRDPARRRRREPHRACQARRGAWWQGRGVPAGAVGRREVGCAGRRRVRAP